MGMKQNIFDRLDLKLGSKDTINVESRLFAQLVSDAELIRFPKCDSLVRTGLRQLFELFGHVQRARSQRPAGRPDRSGIEDQNLQHRPSVDTRCEREHVLTFGGFARQDQYNYYGSPNPFADLIPDLQTNTIGQNRRLTKPGTSRERIVVKGIHNIKLGATWQDTILTEADSFGIVDPTFKRGVFECRRQSGPGPDSNQPGELRRRAATQSGL